MKKIALCMSLIGAVALVLALANMGPLATTAEAFPQYSGDPQGGCVDCHGDFRATNYVPQAAARQGVVWPAGLHDSHRNNAAQNPAGFLNGNCNACHSNNTRFPVFLGTSFSLAPFNQSCTGCHSGPGTRNHHELMVGVGTCSGCHGQEAIGNEKTPLPPVYTAPLGTALQTTRINNPCNDGAAGTVFEGSFWDILTVGLDNDGDGLHDQDDLDCAFVAPETGAECFDGLDNDGDGAIDCADSGCAGATGAATACGVGACAAVGNQVCQGGQLVDTCTPGTPGAEGPFGNPTCADGIDNDCDTTTDAADPGCAPVCVPTQEVCDGLDNDCDGVIDNGIAPVPSTCGTGICAATGQITCVGGQLVDSCTPGAPQAEVCNNVDDDCNGVIDDIAPVPTTCGTGACANTGQLICQNGAPVDTCTPLPAGTEGPFGDATCADGIDNDCDTTTDAADPGCAPVCVPQPEVCDGVDNDCNGLIDDGIAPVDITCGVGACLNTGVRVCANGALQDQCTPLPAGTEGPFGDPTCADGIDNDCDGTTDAADQGCAFVCVPAQEVCDGVDNDCDGVIDNNIPATPTTCGVGACANTGELVCQNGQFVDTCVPLQPGVEGPFGDPTCADNVDNDCDALVDAADPGCAVPPVEEACFDQVDNDGDGLVDCADPDCAGAVNGPCDTGFAGACAVGEARCVNGAAICVQVVFPQPEICTDGIDNDCDGFIDAADPDCIPPVDFDIVAFQAAPRVDICPPPVPQARLFVVIENNSRQRACFDATVVGVLNGVEIYRQVINVCLDGGKTTRVNFPEPNLNGLPLGAITWTATIADGNADIDMATAKTQLVCVPGPR